MEGDHGLLHGALRRRDLCTNGDEVDREPSRVFPRPAGSGRPSTLCAGCALERRTRRRSAYNERWTGGVVATYSLTSVLKPFRRFSRLPRGRAMPIYIYDLDAGFIGQDPRHPPRAVRINGYSDS